MGACRVARVQRSRELRLTQPLGEAAARAGRASHVAVVPDRCFEPGVTCIQAAATSSLTLQDSRKAQRLLIGHPVVVSTAAGRGPRLLARCRAKSRPAPLGGGEVPRAATGRSPTLRACLWASATVPPGRGVVAQSLT